MPPHYSVKDDFMAMNLFQTCCIKTASASRHGSADAETTENPASFYEVKPRSGFTHVVGGFSVVVKTWGTMWYYESVDYFNFVRILRVVKFLWSGFVV